MPISTDLANLRIDNACDIIQLPDSVGLRYYNDWRDVLIDRIIKEKEDFFYNEFIADTVLGQREYTIPKRGDLASDGITVLNGIAKTKKIGVKYKTTDTEYTQVNLRNTDVLALDLLSYDETTTQFYVLSDNSWFLYPTPTESVVGGLIIYGITYPKKLIISDEETLPDQFAKAILLYVASKWYSSQRLFNEGTMFMNEFTAECNRVAVSLSGRVQSPKQVTFPSFRMYK